MAIESAAKLLKFMAAEVDRTATSKSWSRMHDAALAAQVRAGLMLQ
jgi:hypothetical protein